MHSLDEVNQILDGGPSTRLKPTVARIVRRLSAWAWEDMLFDVGRVEWKYGRNEDGTPKNWTECHNVRTHLREAGKLRQPPKNLSKHHESNTHI